MAVDLHALRLAFWSNATIARLGRLDVGRTRGVRMVKSVGTAVSAIDEES